jgi:hypothetical protein
LADDTQLRTGMGLRGKFAFLSNFPAVIYDILLTFLSINFLSFFPLLRSDHLDKFLPLDLHFSLPSILTTLRNPSYSRLFTDIIRYSNAPSAGSDSEDEMDAELERMRAEIARRKAAVDEAIKKTERKAKKARELEALRAEMAAMDSGPGAASPAKPKREPVSCSDLFFVPYVSMSGIRLLLKVHFIFILFKVKMDWSKMYERRRGGQMDYSPGYGTDRRVAVRFGLFRI